MSCARFPVMSENEIKRGADEEIANASQQSWEHPDDSEPLSRVHLKTSRLIEKLDNQLKRQGKHYETL